MIEWHRICLYSKFTKKSGSLHKWIVEVQLYFWWHIFREATQILWNIFSNIVNFWIILFPAEIAILTPSTTNISTIPTTTTTSKAYSEYIWLILSFPFEYHQYHYVSVDVRDRTVTPLCLISYAQPLCQKCIQKQNFFFNSLIEFASVVIKTPTNKSFVRERSQCMLSSLHTVHLCVHWALTPSALFALLFCYSYKISEAHYTCANAVKLNGQW